MLLRRHKEKPADFNPKENGKPVRKPNSNRQQANAYQNGINERVDSPYFKR